MAIPHQLSRKLHDIFGIEAADAMADWMNGIDGGQSELGADMAELRHEMGVGFAKIDARFTDIGAQIAAMRHEQHAESTALRHELHAEFAAFREETRVGLATLQHEIANQSAALRTEIATSKVDTLKWAIGSWIASLALIAALIHVGR